MGKRAVVVLAEGFEEIEAVTPIDVLRRAGVEVTVAGVSGTTVRGAHGVSFGCDATLAAVTFAPDAIVLPGGLPGAENLGASAVVRDRVLQVRDAGGVCAAICAAPAFTFARYGLLDGRRATCYPGFEHHFPPGTQASDERVVVDGRIVTSRGPGTALEFSLTLVDLLTGADAARGLGQGMLAKGN
ncbi:MAG: Protein/nucleic acid deglycase 3 [Steroidobacteraceae bacterium]|nr:Protein/nucleic acid deglycase 3 [Steroidobacteraceae bacterium]